MENVIENNVDALSGSVVENQEVEQVEEVESETSEVASEQPDKPVQSKEENSKFAEYRKSSEAKSAKAVQEAIDKEYSNMYGDSHDIHSKADYDKAMQKQKEEELLSKYKDDEDPESVKKELYKQWEESDPRLQEYEKNKVENHTTKQLAELNADLSETGLDNIATLDDIGNLPSAEKIIDYIKNGKTLSEAYFLANKKEIITKQAEKQQQEAIRKISSNAESSPGSLGGVVADDSFFTKEQVKNMSKDEVNNNYNKILKSTSKW